MKPRILVVSYSDIASDARVLRQVNKLAARAEVTTLSYGSRVEAAADHIAIPRGAASLPQSLRGVCLLALHAHRAAERRVPGFAAVADSLAGRRWDMVVANDARALPLAFAAAAGAPVWVDLHEWAPEERSHVFVWRLLVRPYIVSLCRRYLPQVAAATTVGPRIAALYDKTFGIRPQVLRNMPAYADLRPGDVDAQRIRWVHSGGAIPGRNLEAMIEAARWLEEDVELHLYLVPAQDGGEYMRTLRKAAGEATNVFFHRPVAPRDLPATLNRYDVGTFWIPPFNTNAELTLPNKIFDFIQARLALAIGPSVEMVDLVHEWANGVVAPSCEVDAIVEKMRTVTREDVAAMKAASHEAARVLNFDRESKVIDDIVDRVTGGADA